MMQRRAFLAGVGSVLAGPLAATAQQPAGKVSHVGFLGRGERPFIVTDFRVRLRERGYEEGRNITITTRWDEGNDERRLTILAADLVRLKVDVIVAFTMQASLAAKAATTTVPVVFIAGWLRDLGLSSHHTRPASNLTGFTVADDGINGKQLQLLKEMVPTATHVALLMLPGLASHEHALPESLGAAKQLNLRVLVLKATTAEEIERAFTTAVNARVDAINIYDHGNFGTAGERIPALALSRRLPSLSYFGGYANSGGLMSYGMSMRPIPPRMAEYVDRILKGERPSDLPIEQSSLYDLVINLRTAKALGLQVPESLRARATRLIE
jgi:ABC-type uncharacterized transport system substrate-binding protein